MDGERLTVPAVAQRSAPGAALPGPACSLAGAPRRYRSAGDVWRDLAYVARRAGRLRALDPAFRERLMLVVTAVNACRACAVFHSRLARRAGVPPAQGRALLAGALPAHLAVPARELPALLYARAWAERDAALDPAEEQALDVAYGPPGADAIRVALRAIRLGNLTGNAAGALLSAATGGRLARRRTAVRQ